MTTPAKPSTGKEQRDTGVEASDFITCLLVKFGPFFAQIKFDCFVVIGSRAGNNVTDAFTAETLLRRTKSVFRASIGVL